MRWWAQRATGATLRRPGHPGRACPGRKSRRESRRDWRGWASARGEGRSLGRAGGARWVVGPIACRGEVGPGSRGCGLKQDREEMGLARGEGECGLGCLRAGSGRGRWAAGLVLVGFFLFSISIYSLLSILIQTKFEFKYKFEFKPYSNN